MSSVVGQKRKFRFESFASEFGDKSNNAGDNDNDSGIGE